jgi:cyclopropane-fatty-acyl-phospholipid synthase
MTAPDMKAPGIKANDMTATDMTVKDGIAGVIADLLRIQAGLDLPVRLRAWDGSEAGPADGPILVARSPRALRRILWRPGELGLARAYVGGDLDVDGDLTDGLRRVWAAVAIRQEGPEDGTEPGHAPSSGPAARPKPAARRTAAVPLAAARAAARLRVPVWPPLPAPDCELRVRGRLHSRARDRAVIAGHYDLPAAFYQLILDRSMAYSCADWTRADTLADAQHAKLTLICAKLGLEAGQRLLDLGCGWGSLTVHAARDHRARVTAVTLSAEQGGYVRQRARGLGLGGQAETRAETGAETGAETRVETRAETRVEVRVQDYRDPLDGPYDAIASVEMGEHVGAAQYPGFCEALHHRLKPGGRLLVQQMSRGAGAPGGGPFIESYIAPDMHMRPVGETVRLIENAGFEVIGVQAMREHYVRTIRAWLDRFEANLPAIARILTAEQVRVWRLYLAGGALAFEEGRMGVDQILAVRPDR